MPLDDDKLEALRRWGAGLREQAGGEHAAAGRAILMLIAEVDRLRMELSQARLRPPGEDPASTLHERAAAATSPESWIETLRRQK